MNGIPKELLLSVGGALLCAFAVSFLMCPLVKSFAYKIGAIDVPKDNRRMHKKPVPRLGGLAIFLGFIVSMLLFVKVDHQLQGILLGASIIVVLGVVDDMSPLRAYFKFCVQIFAALVAVFHGVVIQTLSNPNVFAAVQHQHLQQRPLLGAGLAVHPHHSLVDRRYHECRQPHRRPRRPCLRRFDHQRHFDARHRAARL